MREYFCTYKTLKKEDVFEHKYINTKNIKNYLRIEHDYDDEIIRLAVRSAVKYVEEYTEYMLTKTLIKCSLRNRNGKTNTKREQIVYLDYLPVAEVKDVTKNGDGFDAWWNGSDYITLMINDFDKMEIEYIAGCSKIPEDLLICIYKLAADGYYNRTSETNLSVDILDVMNRYRKINV